MWNSLCWESQKSHSINVGGFLGKGYQLNGIAVSCCSETSHSKWGECASDMPFSSNLPLLLSINRSAQSLCPILNCLELIASQQHLGWFQGRISWCFKDQLLSGYFIKDFFLRLIVLLWKNNNHIWFISHTLNSPGATLFLLCTYIY